MTCSQKSAPKPGLILGYTTRRHLLLDLDDTGLPMAMRIARLIQENWPLVGDCLILQSSWAPLKVELRYSWNNWPWIKVTRPSHHLVFDGLIGYNRACRICEVLAGLRVLPKAFMEIRGFRGDMTLRVSSAPMRDKERPTPQIVARVQAPRPIQRGGYIDQFVNLKKIGERLFLFEDLAESIPDYGTDRADGGR